MSNRTPALARFDRKPPTVKEKYGSDVDEDEEDDEDSEEAESEDEDGEELTPAVDAAILRTLARIKRKDPSIYEQGKDIFEGEVYANMIYRCTVNSGTRFNSEEKQRTQDVQISRRANKDKVCARACSALLLRTVSKRSMNDVRTLVEACNHASTRSRLCT